MDQHMADDMAQRFLMFGPVVEIGRREVMRFGIAGFMVASNAAALEQAEQVEGRFRRHVPTLRPRGNPGR
jgi:hypothetical protein